MKTTGLNFASGANVHCNSKKKKRSRFDCDLTSRDIKWFNVVLSLLVLRTFRENCVYIGAV